MLLRDARFYDPLARDRFTVALPNITCEPIEETADVAARERQSAE